MTHTSAMQKARERVQAWLDGGCSSWGLPADDIRALISETAAKDAEIERLNRCLNLAIERTDENFTKAVHNATENASLRKKVEELEAERDEALFGVKHQTELKMHARKCCDDAERRATSAEAEAAALRKALEPFARLAEKIERDYPDCSDHILLFFDLTHGDFRRARAALKSAERLP